MSIATAPRPTIEAPVAITANEAFKNDLDLLDAGWRPLEDSTDFRALAPAESLAGKEYTIVYIPGRKLIGKANTAMFKTGRATVPACAAFSEIYVATSTVVGSTAWSLTS